MSELRPERLEDLVSRADPEASWGSGSRNDAILLSLFTRCVQLEEALREIGAGVRGDEAADIAHAALAA